MESLSGDSIFPPHSIQAQNKKLQKTAKHSTTENISNAKQGFIMPLRTLQTSKDKPYLTEGQKHAARRVGDLTRIYRDQYPNGLPHNDVGVAYSKYICRTMAFLPNDRRSRWLDRYAPWMDAEIRGGILDLGPYWYSARSLGNRLEIDNEARERLQAWTIEAYDITKEQREVINREKNKASHEQGRRKAGAKPRKQSLSQTKPWEAENISRSTWERRRKAGDANSSRPSLSISRKDELASAAPSQPKGPTLAGREIPAMSQQEPIAPSKPQAAVVSLAEYLARRKAAAIAWRDVSDAPQKIAA
jgi:hypothetical protein